VIKVEIRITRDEDRGEEIGVEVYPSVYREVDVSGGVKDMGRGRRLGEEMDGLVEGAEYGGEGMRGVEDARGAMNEEGSGVTVEVDGEEEVKREYDDVGPDSIEASLPDQHGIEENMEMNEGVVAEFGGAGELMEGEDTFPAPVDEALATFPKQENIKEENMEDLYGDG
jgi:hypothetical protein